MKKLCLIITAVLAVFCLVGCGSNSTASETQPPATADSAETGTNAENQSSNILVAYFSRAGENHNVGVIEKGNTQIVAEMIAESTGGELFKIETVSPYPDSYEECTEVAKQEQADNARPELNANVDNIADYDVIFLGYPIWWGDMPMAVYTFLESYDFVGKTIVPFCTHEGSGLSSTVADIQNACNGADVMNGLAIQGSVAQNSQAEAKTTVADWLAEAGFAN